MSRNKIVAVTAGSLAAAAGLTVLAVVRHRQGHPPTPEDLAGLDELDKHLEVALTDDPEAKHIRRFWGRLMEAGVHSPMHIRERLARLRTGDLSEEEAIDLEATVDHIDARARQQDL